MIAAQESATKEAAKTYEQRRERMVEVCRAWPDTLDNTQIKQRCVMNAIEMGYHPRSFKIKAKRLGLIAYDPARKVWLNRSR